MPDLTFGFVASGTGNDFRRSFGIEDGIEASIRRLGSGATRQVDVGRLTFTRDDGSTGIRHFCNIASFGLSGATDRAVAGATVSRLLGAKGLFAFQVIATLMRYRFKTRSSARLIWETTSALADWPLAIRPALTRWSMAGSGMRACA